MKIRRLLPESTLSHFLRIQTFQRKNEQFFPDVGSKLSAALGKRYGFSKTNLQLPI